MPTRSNEWLARQLELSGASHSRNWMKVCYRVTVLRVLCKFCVFIPCDPSYRVVQPLEFDNGAEAIARIPCALAGAPVLTSDHSQQGCHNGVHARRPWHPCTARIRMERRRFRKSRRRRVYHHGENARGRIPPPLDAHRERPRTVSASRRRL